MFRSVIFSEIKNGFDKTYCKDLFLRTVARNHKLTDYTLRQAKSIDSEAIGKGDFS